MTIADISSVVKLEEDTLGESLGKEMFIRNIKENELAKFYVLENNGVILGYISTICSTISGEILNFCVNKDYQGKGYGTKILDKSLNELKKYGVESVLLEVKRNNIKAINIYNKFGFINISIRRNYYKDGQDAIVMQKKM